MPGQRAVARLRSAGPAAPGPADGRTTATVEAWKSVNGRQPGDPAKLAHALLTIAGQDEPPQRFLAGADAIEGATAKARELLAQAEASRALGGSLGHDDTGA
ncbi:hypothetical protein ACFXPN_32795 [Streptomyces griseorubiginosus]|uniref:hypothetical protein n=1 Tax=Streptomyces griseorubiginosus TaxID=67304 RepID=UPI0036BF05B7